jgi:endoglucanase
MPTIHWARARVVLPLVMALGVVTSCGASGGEPAAPSSSSPSSTPSSGSVAVVSWPSAQEANDAIGKGVEIVSPCCGETPPLDIEAQAVAARSKGFTGIRYAVRLFPENIAGFVDQTDPEWLAKFLDKVRAEIDVLTRHGLTVVLNFNQGFKADRNSDPLVDRWAAVAERFRDLPSSVYFEVMNEPNYGGGFSAENAVSPDEWNAIVARVIPVIRETNPQRIIVVPSALWSTPQAIPELELPAGDEHLIATFHNYFPVQFTHQGSWDKAWIGTTWTGTPDEVTAMKTTMNDAVCWSRHTGVPLFNGEFSSYDAGTYVDQDPMLWNKTMVQLMEAENISWTYFLIHGHLDETTQHISYDSLRDFDAGVWNQPVLDALEQGQRERIEPWANCEGNDVPTSASTPVVPSPSPGR